MTLGPKVRIAVCAAITAVQIPVCAYIMALMLRTQNFQHHTRIGSDVGGAILILTTVGLLCAITFTVRVKSRSIPSIVALTISAANLCLFVTLQCAGFIVLTSSQHK